MTRPLPVINIKAQSNHHALFLMLVSVVIALFTFIFSQGYWRQFHLVIIFIYLCALVIFITGLAKYLEPKYSLSLNPTGIKYQHRYGQWQVEWQEVQRISLINETSGLATIQLPYIGIRLLNLSSLADKISPRLANRLIHEQKPLVAFAMSQKLLPLEQSLINFEPFTLSSGEIITGPLAAFLHHCALLHQALGYHLYLPETAIDRDLNEFCTLLTQCMRASTKYN
ncbi:DUF2982 domain-containing protein [Colwellia psychrerythraea]|uniref:DUF2982 domain-containing protein n=1 Tax=Colwellia psychrerythraea TaxID=28229 RepID=A0A099K973_COLPS|nr:DUF2982 domain-containing protein [Colwellia psychrerythraea]KGJ87294.1 Protein of unknown function DUF2982 [Colwellia psychrerythraea]